MRMKIWMMTHLTLTMFNCLRLIQLLCEVKYDIVSLRPNCRNKSLNLIRLYLRLRGFSGNLRASNLDISVRIWAKEPRRFYGSPGGGVALKKHLTKPPEFRGSLFPKGAQCLMIEDQGANCYCDLCDDCKHCSTICRGACQDNCRSKCARCLWCLKDKYGNWDLRPRHGPRSFTWRNCNISSELAPCLTPNFSASFLQNRTKLLYLWKIFL